MRLYLSSFRLGNRPERMLDLLRGGTRAAVVTNADDYKDVDLRAGLEEFHAAGDTAMIAGDFNAEPDHAVLNNWYASSVHTPNNSKNTGAYREIDDTHTDCPGYGEMTYPGAETSGP